MTELMKQYEDEQDRIAVVEHSTGKVYLPDYIAWLEAKAESYYNIITVLKKRWEEYEGKE